MHDLYRLQTAPEPCSYLPDEKWRFDYRYPKDLDSTKFGELLRRGWRRFGLNVFRPFCDVCRQCRSIRVVVDDFRPSKSERRTMKKNAHIRVVVQPPTISAEHIELYNDFHRDMTERRNWPVRITSPHDYIEHFIGADYEFAREFLYFDNDRLVGVGIVDETPLGLSSAYFFHDPAWRPLGAGTFSVLTEIEYARSRGIPHVYLGYWIAQNPSMNYKAKYQPHELLERFVDDDVEPTWLPSTPE